MHQDSRQGVLELLLGLLHLLLVGGLVVHQPADVAVGGLDHGVEVVGVAAVDLAPLHPGQQDTDGLGKLSIVCGTRGTGQVVAIRRQGKGEAAQLENIMCPSLGLTVQCVSTGTETHFILLFRLCTLHIRIRNSRNSGWGSL